MRCVTNEFLGIRRASELNEFEKSKLQEVREHYILTGIRKNYGIEGRYQFNMTMSDNSRKFVRFAIPRSSNTVER